MPAELEVSLSEARNLILTAQGLGTNPVPLQGEAGTYETIQRLAYLQIDSISVVCRAHHHTLWTRQSNYIPENLNKLLAKRLIFEYWGHAASYLPMQDYRYYLHRMERFKDPTDKRLNDRLERCRHLMTPALDRIREEGPLGASDFSKPKGYKSGVWWDWKPAKIALELLYCRGELMVSERRNFQKIYDLPERVLPTETNVTSPGKKETARFFITRALEALGIATANVIREYLRAPGKSETDMGLRKLMEAGIVASVRLEGCDGRGYFALQSLLENALQIQPPEAQLHILSPFDNLVIQRRRLQQIFGIEYVLECYLPAQKRVYGYFVLPILWGDRFIGRIDAKAHRAARTLIIKNLVFEPGTGVNPAGLSGLSDKIKAFAEFNNCNNIVIEKGQPFRLIDKLKRLLK